MYDKCDRCHLIIEIEMTVEINGEKEKLCAKCAAQIFITLYEANKALKK
jgi:hypothetical protein